MKPAEHSHHPHASAASPTLPALLAACRAAGLRRTQLLRHVLRVLVERQQPVNTRQLLNTRGIAGACNPATLYRLLQRLEEKGLVRRIGLHERAAHYTLPHDHHHDYVVCGTCGEVEVLAMKCPVEQLERQIGRRTGFKKIYHELLFYGVCPQCDATEAATVKA